MARRIALIRQGWYARQIGQAGALYVRAGGSDAVVLSLIKALAHRPERTALESICLASQLVRMGRRRLVDRLVLSASALLRWL
jgi:hypothetical protein